MEGRVHLGLWFQREGELPPSQQGSVAAGRHSHRSNTL